MEFTGIATEQTTAVTDALLALLATACIVVLQRVRSIEFWKVRCWTLALAFLGASSLLGAVVHGIKMPAPLRQQLWMPLNLLLVMTAVFIITGTIYDGWGRAAAGRALTLLLTVAAILLAAIFLGVRARILLLPAEEIGLLFTGGTYLKLAVGKQLRGATYVLAGMIVTLLAALVQASKIISFDLLWQFDANGVFHMVQMPALVLITIGVHQSLQRQKG
jgi:hypothetical protein